MIFAVYCRNCGKDTGIAVKDKSLLTEIEYCCGLCGLNEKANQGIIEAVNKDLWKGELNYYKDK